MIKFIHKKHLHAKKESGKIVVYYNVTDIFLGIILMALVVFFIHDYLSHNLEHSYNGGVMSPYYGDQAKIKPPFRPR